jgi:ABC-type glycerol-3-phosphate transport system permease component
VEHHAGLGGLDLPVAGASVFAAYAIERLRFKGAQARSALAIFLAYLVPPSILFIPLAVVFKLRPVRHAAGADPDLPDLPDPVLHLAADGLLQARFPTSSRNAR